MTDQSDGFGPQYISPHYTVERRTSGSSSLARRCGFIYDTDELLRAQRRAAQGG